MTLELATRTIDVPEGIADDVFIRVGKFTFPADFVVVDYEVDPRVPLILGRSFLRTAHALVDLHGENLTLRVGDEELIFNVESASKHPQKHSDNSIHKIDILDTTCEDHVHEDSEGDILFLERLLDDDPSPDLPPNPHPVCLINDAEKIKSSIEDPPDLILKDLPSHLEYVFLEGTSKLPIIIDKDLRSEEKEQLLKILMEEYFKPAIQQQRWVNPKIHEVIKAEVIKLLDAGLIYPISDSPWTDNLAIFKSQLIPKTRKRPRSPVRMEHLLIKECPLAFAMLLGHSNGEKCHFMVKEGIVLGHKISKNGLEVDKAKVDVIAKLPPPTTVKGDTPFIFLDECRASFKILKKWLTKAPILVSPDWDLPFELMCDASDYVVGAVLGQRKDKYFRPIHYASKTLSDAQTNYTVTEKSF
ncbi:reverse transcriptase domain-containing protein [Tanacetum coccineum]